MIGSLSGKIQHKQPPWVLLDVNGVGYEMEAPMTTFYDLPEVGQVVSLHTHMVVREDAQLLYAFSRLNERDLFRLLLKINGIGPRVALAILSTLTTEEFVRCVHFEDIAQLTRVPGIGKKTAERVLIEMRDKVGDLSDLVVGESDAHVIKAETGTTAQFEQDALIALETLGYKKAQASSVIKRIMSEQDSVASSEELIRLSLKTLSLK